MKKQWQSPQLNPHGSVEELTQASLRDITQLSGFSLPDQAFGLLASLEI